MKRLLAGMNLKVGLHIYLIILLSILFSFKSIVRAQGEEDIPELDIPVNVFTLCPEESMIMDVSVSGTPPVFIEYTFNDVMTRLESMDENVMQIILADTGYYFINRYGDSTHTVTSSEYIYVDAHPAVNLKLEGGGIFCNYDEPIPITAHFEGVPPFTLTYLWENVRYDTTTDQYSLTFSEHDDFNIEVRIVEDGNNCTLETNQPATLSIIEVPQPPVYGDSTACVFSNSLYTSEFSNFTPQWEIPTGAESREGIISNGTFVAVTWVIPGNHTVNLHLTDLNSGCKSVTTTLPVLVYDQPPIPEDPDTIVCFDLETEMHIDLTTQAGDIVYWPELNAYGPSVDLYETGIYSYILTDELSCADTGHVTLTEICYPEFHVPEAFTPNGDGLNDELEIFGVYFNLRFTVFSPSGQELFYTEDPTEFWNGRKNGKDLPNGRYYWSADYSDKYGAPYSQNGYVMLMR